MEDVISDNSSSSQFLIGEKVVDFNGKDIKNLKMEMFVDGEIAQEGFASAISGDPVLSVVELCRLLATRNQTLAAGTLVLAGAATPAVALKEGMKIQLKVDGFFPIDVKITS